VSRYDGICTQALPRIPGPVDDLTTFARLRAIPAPADRALIVAAYITQQKILIQEARQIRDAAIIKLVAAHGPAEAARLAGVSVSHVKALRRRGPA